MEKLVILVSIVEPPKIKMPEDVAVIIPKYHKITKYVDTQKIAVIMLKFKQYGSTIELWVKKMQMEWQTV